MKLLDLPEDILIAILSRLSFERLLKIKPVCRYVRRLIEQHPSLASKPCMHLLLVDELGYLPPISLVSNFANPSTTKSVEIPDPLRGQPNSDGDEQIRTLGSCNGLMLQSVDKKNLFVWNPSTGGHKPVSPIEFASPPHQPECHSRVYGLGFDINTEDYKVVLIKHYWVRTSNSLSKEVVLENQVGIYSLREDSWRIIDDSCPYQLFQREDCDDLFLNGALHWIGYADIIIESCPCELPEREGCDDLFLNDPLPAWREYAEPGTFKRISYKAHHYRRIVAFDFGVEKFKEIPLPDDYQREVDDNFFDVNFIRIGVWRECLCVLRNICRGRADIIVMKEYGVKGSWSELYTISQETAEWMPRGEYVMKLVCFTTNDKIVLQLGDEFLFGNLFLYDPVRRIGNKLEISGGTPLHFLNDDTCHIRPYRTNLQYLKGN